MSLPSFQINDKFLEIFNNCILPLDRPLDIFGFEMECVTLGFVLVIGVILYMILYYDGFAFKNTKRRS